MIKNIFTQVSLLLFILFFFGQSLSGQILLSPGPAVTPNDMVENIVGDGIVYDNVVFHGANISRGIFSNGNSTNLGIDAGIFLTSGSAYTVPGPNGSCSAGTNNNTPGDATLNSITTSTTHDAAVLEFDFVPESDTLKFQYVFGSEEYNDYVNSSFNDVFGYFVSGPDPEGGFYSNKNIAIVPGTENTSVTINNVNNGYAGCNIPPTGPCSFCSMYTDNTGGLTLEYDGKTVVLTAFVLVVACETYHIKMGVADAGDGIFDSGVFIKENSFTSPKIDVQTDPYPAGVSDNMIEGCVEADIVFALPNAEYAPITVHFDLSQSTANPAAYPAGDFEETIPDSITFEEGQDSAIIHVIPVKDGILEGEETLELIVENTLGCTVRYDTVIFYIEDYIDMATQPSPNTMICQGQEAQIWVNTFNGIPLYTYEWENDTTSNDTITVSPDTTTTYVVNVFDMCLDSVADSVQVIVFPTPDVDLGDTAYICNGDTLVLHAGSGYISYLWQDGSTDSLLQVISGGMYAVAVTGPGGCMTVDSVFVDETTLAIDLGTDTSICVGDSAIFTPGDGFSSYHWQDGSTGSSITATTTGTYWVQVTQNGCTVSDSIYLFVDDPNLSFSLGNDTSICTNDFITLQPLAGIYNSYLWSTGDSSSSISVTQPGTYSLDVESGCGNASASITISNWPIPNPYLGPDTNLCYGDAITLEAPFGFNSYTWQDGSDVSYYDVTQPGVYFVTVEDYHGCPGSDTIAIDIGSIVDLGEDSLVLCAGDQITLDATSEFDFYTWSTGEFGVPSIELDSGGWYKVDVNYLYGCPSADSVYVDEFPVPNAVISGDDNLCAGDTVWLSSPQGKYDIYWNNTLSTENTYMVLQGGTVSLKLANVCGEDEDQKDVAYHELPQVSLGEDVVLFPGENVNLDAGEFESYLWNDDPALTTRYYMVNYSDTGVPDSIYVEVNDGVCKNTDAIVIEMFNIKIPNIITPNGDNKNDIFAPINMSGINKHTISVFNRWGEKVWESNDFSSGWDGKRNGKYVAEGTYYYILEVSYGPENLNRVYKGTLSVLGTGN